MRWPADGKAVVAWAQTEISTGVGYKRIWSASRPLGGSFGSPAMIVETVTADSANRPVLALNDSGEGVLAWHQPWPGGGNRALIEAAPRNADGSLGTPNNLTTNGDDVNGPVATAINSSGEGITAWSARTGAGTPRVEGATF